MGFKKVVKKGFLSGFNVKRWVGMDNIKESTATVGKLYSGFFKTKPVNANKETFEEAMHHYGLSEIDVKNRMKSSFRIAIGCLIGGVLVLVYTLYLFTTGLVFSSLISFMIGALLFSYAFREHFNYFQMKQRRLGCTFREWLQGSFKRVK